MKILTIDTATKILYVNVSSDGKTLAARGFAYDSTHLPHIIPAIDEILCLSGLNLDAIDFFAASIGPGSFTGLRVGVATIQGLALTKEKKCLAVNTLDACAEVYRQPDHIVCSMLEARNRRIYGAAYWGDKVLIAPCVGGVEDFFQELRRLQNSEDRLPSKLFFAGDEAADFYSRDDAIREMISGPIETAPSPLYDPQVLAGLAYREAEAGRIVEISQLLPEYYAPTQVERNYGIYV